MLFLTILPLSKIPRKIPVTGNKNDRKKIDLTTGCFKHLVMTCRIVTLVLIYCRTVARVLDIGTHKCVRVHCIEYTVQW